MSKISEQKYEEQAKALRLIGSIATAFDIATKHQGGKYNGAIGSAGRYIIDALAMKRGAFFRPVPFKYVELCESTGFSQQHHCMWHEMPDRARFCNYQRFTYRPHGEAQLARQSYCCV